MVDYRHKRDGVYEIYTHVTKSMHDDVINKLNQRQVYRGNTYKLATFLPPNRYSDKQSQLLSVVIAQYLLSPPFK